jgi:peptide-methionine (S)-S-oxide reductase
VPHTPHKSARRPGAATAAKPPSNFASKMLVLAGVFMLGALLYAGATSGAKPAVALPAPAVDIVAVSPPATSTVVFAGGCFWGVQAVFQHTRGVLNAVSGYAGGTPETATYPHVSSGKTGHAEAVAITYDPQVVTYGQLLQIFFSVAHDPTEIDRQGPDYGPQYRSAIFYAHPDEQRVAQQYIAQLDATQLLPRKIATTLAPLTQFYPAEEEHQDYATRNPHSIYIATYDRPKITQLQTLMPDRFREAPVLVADQARQ